MVMGKRRVEVRGCMTVGQAAEKGGRNCAYSAVL